MEFIKSQVIADTGFAAGGAAIEADLGVNGLSFLFFHLTGLQAADNVPVQVQDLLLCLDNIDVAYNGQSVFNGAAVDLARLSFLICGVPPIKRHAAEAANAETGVGFILPFGRKPFDPDEGFPAVPRGTLRLRVTPAASLGDVGSPELNVQQVELPGQRFKRFNKATVRAATPAATGDFDFRLPIGNRLRGVLMFVTTRVLNLNSPGSVQGVTLLVNNTERLYTGGHSVFEQFLACAKWMPHPHSVEFALMENSAAMYTQNASTGAIPVATVDLMDNYVWADMDWNRDDSCALETAGFNDLVFRANVATANALRVLPYESVVVPAGK